MMVSAVPKNIPQWDADPIIRFSEKMALLNGETKLEKKSSLQETFENLVNVALMVTGIPSPGHVTPDLGPLIFSNCFDLIFRLT